MGAVIHRWPRGLCRQVGQRAQRGLAIVRDPAWREVLEGRQHRVGRACAYQSEPEHQEALQASGLIAAVTDMRSRVFENAELSLR
jgi:hypothetical protein